MAYKLIPHSSPILQRLSVPVLDFNPELLDLLSGLKDIMFQEGGVGISAPQVGISQRVMVISDGSKVLIPMVNPQVISHSEEVILEEEGCLSYPGLFLMFDRPKVVTATWQDEDGNSLERELDDLLARVFWHELDHLNGITLRNRVSNLKWNRWIKGRVAG